MKRNTNSVDKTLKTAGIIILAAAALTYPAMKLYKYYMAKRRAEKEKEDNMNQVQAHEEHHKAFSPSLLGDHKPHHRKAKAENHVTS